MDYILRLQSKKLLFKYLFRILKKLVLVLAIFMLIIVVDKKNNMILKRIPYIYYLIRFKKKEIRALINFNNKINIIFLKYTLKLCLKVYHINIEAQKTDSFTLKIFEIVLASC